MNLHKWLLFQTTFFYTPICYSWLLSLCFGSHYSYDGIEEFFRISFIKMDTIFTKLNPLKCKEETNYSFDLQISTYSMTYINYLSVPSSLEKDLIYNIKEASWKSSEEKYNICGRLVTKTLKKLILNNLTNAISVIKLLVLFWAYSVYNSTYSFTKWSMAIDEVLFFCVHKNYVFRSHQ